MNQYNYYTITHSTRFLYSAPIRESMMETRMQPRTEGPQQCLSFNLRTSPPTKVYHYRDYLGNMVHHFDIPQAHNRLEIVTRALIQMEVLLLPQPLGEGAWQALDEHVAASAVWDWLNESHFIRFSPALLAFEQSLGLARHDDPFTVLRNLTHQLYDYFEYVPQSTSVDSPLDEALESGRGVCQDYSHVMIALVRRLGIPCRYVSGYLFHRTGPDADRSAQDATHAWVEAWLPEYGWVGFDPTNDLIAAERHIRVAVGRDYSDVPPTRGVFKGQAESTLEVAVQVLPAEAPPEEEEPVPSEWASQGEPLPQMAQAQQQ